MRTLASTPNVSGMLERLKHTIETAGIRIFARIDHAAAARPEGFVMANTFVIIYGHPKARTPVMLAAPAAAVGVALSAARAGNVNAVAQRTSARAMRVLSGVFIGGSSVGWDREKRFQRQGSATAAMTTTATCVAAACAATAGVGAATDSTAATPAAAKAERQAVTVING